MEHFVDMRVSQHPAERGQGADGWHVDDGGLVIERDLDQLQPGNEGLLADELGIEPDAGRLREALAQVAQPRVVGHVFAGRRFHARNAPARGAFGSWLEAVITRVAARFEKSCTAL